MAENSNETTPVQITPEAVNAYREARTEGQTEAYAQVNDLAFAAKAGRKRGVAIVRKRFLDAVKVADDAALRRANAERAEAEKRATANGAAPVAAKPNARV